MKKQIIEKAYFLVNATVGRLEDGADFFEGIDVRFKAGPELILKDEKSASHAINKDQPDSALGLGMQLELGF